MKTLKVPTCPHYARLEKKFWLDSHFKGCTLCFEGVHHVVVLLRLRTLQTYWSTYISEVLIVSIFYSRVKTPYIYYVPNIPSNDTMSVC